MSQTEKLIKLAKEWLAAPENKKYTPAQRDSLRAFVEMAEHPNNAHNLKGGK